MTYNKKYYEENKDKFKAWRKIYYEANKEKMLLYGKEYRAKHYDSKKEVNRVAQWKKNNPEKHRAQWLRHYKKKQLQNEVKEQ